MTALLTEAARSGQRAHRRRGAISPVTRIGPADNVGRMCGAVAKMSREPRLGGDMGAFAVMFTRFRVFLFVAGAGAVLIALDEMSGFLGNVAGSDGSSASMDVLPRPHFGLSPITAAVAAWGSSGSQHLAANLIIWSLIADVFFMGVYGFVLYKIIEWATDGMPTRTKNLYWGLAATIAADVVEDVASFAIHASVYHAHSAPTAWVVVAVVATWLKWVSLVLTVLIALAMRLAQPAAALPVGYSGMSPHQKLHAQAGALVAALPAPSSRIWTRLRVQLACSLIFGTLIAYPGGGALDQVTDTIRTLADGRHWQPALLARVVPVIALLCPALWFGGRLALLDDRVDQLRKKPHSPRFVLVVGAALAAVYTLARLADGPDFALRAVGGYGLPFVAGGVLALVAICTHKWPWDKSRDALGRIDAPIGLNRGQVRDAVLIITVMPIAAFGLGVMRAFLLDAFVSGSSTAFWITITGLTIAVGGTAGVFYGLKAVEGPLFGDTRSGNVPPAVSRFRLLVGLQVVLGAGVVVAALGLAIDPLDFAKPFHAVGVVATFVATLAFLGGIAQWCSEVRTPMLVFRKLHFRRGPIVILATAVFVVAGFLNAGARYHDVRMARDTAAVTARSLADEVDSWADQAVTCAGARFSDGSIPMVFVAAPGGGIRAAFWTDHALAAIERTPCGQQRVFAASGVSGGSVGLAIRYAPAGDGMTATNVFPSQALAGEDALAANTDGEFFRDLPASLIGLDRGWDDRAGLLERAWQHADPALAEPFYASMQPGVVGASGQDWRPVLVFNGTEVATGCRVLVSTMRLSASDISRSASGCTSNHVVTGGADDIVPASMNLQDFAAARTTTCPAGRAVELTIATAAHLSARFPYVSPTGGLHGCRAAAGTTGGDRSVNITDSDGGANENSGIDTLLDIYGAVRPTIAAYESKHTGVHIRPVMVLLHNGYVGTGAPKKAAAAPQLLAPKSLLAAAKLGSNEDVLLQRAEVTFGSNVYVVAPQSRPSIQAPLGWTLSDITQRELSKQLGDQLTRPCTDLVAQTPGSPNRISCLIDVLK